MNPQLSPTEQFFLSRRPLGLLLLPLALTACRTVEELPKVKPPLAMVTTMVFVAQDGSAPFTNVQAAIMSVPMGYATNPVVIYIKPGIYKEQLYIQREKRFFILRGESATNTVLTFDLNANLPGLDGKPIGTFRTQSTYIDAEDFTAENLTFANSDGPV